MKGKKGSLNQLWRVLIALILVSAFHPFLATPASAADIVIEQCDEAGLTGALTTVQGSGGGIITFSCGPDPITITIIVMKNIITDVTINGGGMITLSGGNTTRLFRINAGASLTLQDITFREGFSSGADGGAIWNEGSLMVENSKFLENSSDLTKSGGAIVSYGPLKIIDSEFSDNLAYNGGAVYPRHSGAVTNISGSTFLRNQALGDDGKGGALMAWDGPPVTVSDSIFKENFAAHGGGGIYIMANSSLNLEDSSLEDNTTLPMGMGGGALFIEGTAIITHTNIISNTGSQGGGLYNSGSTTINFSLIQSNFASFGGGGISNETGSLILKNSSVVDNTAFGTAGGILAFGTATVLNSTFIGNNVRGMNAYGGAIYAAGDVSLNFSTLLDNGADGSGEYGETLYFFPGTSLSLKNSIVRSEYPACYYMVTSLGSNIVSDVSCVSGIRPSDHPNTRAQLGLWQDPDGAIWYTMPLVGGNAHNSGDCGDVTTDQRGFPRLPGLCDRGAIERQPGDPMAYLYLPLTKR